MPAATCLSMFALQFAIACACPGALLELPPPLPEANATGAATAAAAVIQLASSAILPFTAVSFPRPRMGLSVGASYHSFG